MEGDDFSFTGIGFDPSFVAEISENMSTTCCDGDVAGDQVFVIQSMEVGRVSEAFGQSCVFLAEGFCAGVVPPKRQPVTHQSKVQRVQPFAEAGIDHATANQS